eukprot:TRINITY_DN95429_c0_g1_i1.p1 TRINITY_DN95429_c0_g1~~TRINITY_DN95429_c0_g1_i1.p1  ORF type:complete len:535 (-),score=101.95 TRINITY_DN95429_c0_g1_i1:20-1390(-)
MIVLNKCDLASAAQQHEAKTVLKLLNPEAGVIPAKRAAVPEYEVVGRGAYMLDELKVKQPTRRWLEQAHADDKSMAQPQKFAAAAFTCNSSCCGGPGFDSSQGDIEIDDAASGVSSFIYRPARPFHPARVAALASRTDKSLPSEVLRIKGMAWIASRLLFANQWSTAGQVTEIRRGPAWWSAVPPGLWPAHVQQMLRDQGLRTEQGSWLNAEHGDRHTELFVIGKDMKRSTIVAWLDELVLTQEEFDRGPAFWATLEDTREMELGLDDSTLSYLASLGHEGIVRGLCMQRADPNSENLMNKGTPLHSAALKGRVSTLQTLLEFRANANAVAQRGMAPLHLSVCPGVVTLLCDHRADMQKSDANGHTALHHAVALGRGEVVEALLTCRASVNSLTSSGETPLHLAATDDSRDSAMVVRLLCDAKADPDLVSGSSGHDALSLAAGGMQSEQEVTLQQS